MGVRPALLTWAAQSWILAASRGPTTRIGSGLPSHAVELVNQRSTPVTAISSGKVAGTPRCLRVAYPSRPDQKPLAGGVVYSSPVQHLKAVAGCSRIVLAPLYVDTSLW